MPRLSSASAVVSPPMPPPMMTTFAGDALLLFGMAMALLRFDVGVADDAAEVVILLAQISREIGAAHGDRIEPMRLELRPHLGRLDGGGKPAGKLRQRLIRSFRRRI